MQTQKLGVVPGMTIGHVGYWGEVFHNHILGPERAKRLDPTGSLVKRNMRFAFHSDSPVTPYGPLQYISAPRACGKAAAEGPRSGSAHCRRSGDQGGHARRRLLDVHRRPHRSLEVGKWADFAILDRNPRATDPDRIPEIKVLGPWLTGKPAYVAPETR